MKYTALETKTVRQIQAGGPDAYGQAAARALSDGQGNPCRHCLKEIPEGAAMLVLAYRPFATLQPYAETGPVFLCANLCSRGGGPEIPEILTTSPDYLVKGYDSDHRIVYGTGTVLSKSDLPARAEKLLDDPRVAYLHVRSARNNCYQLRIDP